MMLGTGAIESASPRSPSTERMATLGGGGGVGGGVGMGVGPAEDGPPQAAFKTANAAKGRMIRAAKRLRARGSLVRGARPRPGRFIEVPEPILSGVHTHSVKYLFRHRGDDPHGER